MASLRVIGLLLSAAALRASAQAQGPTEPLVQAASALPAACTDGMVGMIEKQAPECISACPGSCSALDQATKAFIRNGGQPAAKRVVCRNQEAFACYVRPENIGKCQSLIDKAASFHFTLPTSPAELEAKCPKRAEGEAEAGEEARAVDEARAEQEAEQEAAAEDAGALAEGSLPEACTTGLVGAVKNMAPQCIMNCPQACSPLGMAIDAYMKQGGQPAAKRVVCAHKAEFSCYVSQQNIGHCQSLIDKAKGFGFTLPDTQDKLNQQCHRRLRADPVSEPAEEAPEVELFP